MAIEALAEGKTFAEVAQKHHLNPDQATQWRWQLMERAAGMLSAER